MSSDIPNTFVVSWCEEGIEGIISVTELEKTDMWNALKAPSGQNPGGGTAVRAVNMMVMRARFNPQRHYEVYSISAVDGITEKDLRILFKESPQYAADLLRERGVQLFSDRRDSSSRIKIK